MAQEVLSTNPPSLKWSQVNTPYFRVLFPQGFETQGQRVANTLEHIRKAEAKSLGSYPRLITIILHNQSSVSNGFVSMVPRRSEFYAMPSQDYNFLGNNDWLDLLASHEYRHIVQYQHANRGFTRLLYYFFGAPTMAGMAHAAVPSWFWEGDAVATETAFTRSGRGKIPNFSLLFKTNLLEGRTFNYHKQYLRSYKHNIPDHYVLGYHMVSYLRKSTNDPEIWGKISGRAWKVPFVPFTFSSAIKSKAGLSVTKLYREMAGDIKKRWQQQIDTLQLSEFSRITAKRKGYTDFLYPHQLGDGSVLVMKTGIGNITEFARIGKDEKKVFIPGFINDSGMISAQGSTIVWNEYGYDPRWEVRNYSLIKTYDLKSKKRHVIGGKKSRYTSAAISPDETKIAAIQTGTDYKTKLEILSYPDGNVLHEFENPKNDFYSMPRWSDDGKKIVSLKTTTEGKTIVQIDAVTHVEELIFPYSEENFGYPILVKNYVIYNSPVTGIDNIFAVNLSSGKRYQVTTSKYGAYNPSISRDGKTMFYNDQTRDGLDVVKIPFEPSSWQPYVSREEENSSYQFLVAQEGHENMVSKAPQQTLEVTRYHKANGIFNPFAWGFFTNNTFTQGNIGISSQDLMSTTIIQAGYNFDILERTFSLQAGVSYQGLFPIIDVDVAKSDRSLDKAIGDEIVNFKWSEKKLEAGIRVPLLLTSSKFSENILIGNKVGITKVTDFSNSVDNGGRIVNGYLQREYIDDGVLLYNNTNLTASRLLKRSKRDINSKWGQRFQANYFTTPYGGDFKGNLLSFTGIIYLPGLMPHHSLWGYGAYQKTFLAKESTNYIFRNQIPTPRGHSNPFRSQQFYSASANYTFPLWYPDISIGPLLNIQRLRMNFFFDYGLGRSPAFLSEQMYTSVGAEAKLDINIMRFLPQFDIGVRFSQGLTPTISKFEVLIGTINL